MIQADPVVATTVDDEGKEFMHLSDGRRLQSGCRRRSFFSGQACEQMRHWVNAKMAGALNLMLCIFRLLALTTSQDHGSGFDGFLMLVRNVTQDHFTRREAFRAKGPSLHVDRASKNIPRSITDIVPSPQTPRVQCSFLKPEHQVQPRLQSDSSPGQATAVRPPAFVPAVPFQKFSVFLYREFPIPASSASHKLNRSLLAPLPQCLGPLCQEPLKRNGSCKGTRTVLSRIEN